MLRSTNSNPSVMLSAKFFVMFNSQYHTTCVIYCVFELTLIHVAISQSITHFHPKFHQLACIVILFCCAWQLSSAWIEMVCVFSQITEIQGHGLTVFSSTLRKLIQEWNFKRWCRSPPKCNKVINVISLIQRTWTVWFSPC